MTRRSISDLERWVVLLLILVFGAEAAASFLRQLIDKHFTPDATLTAIAVTIVGAAVTHLLVSDRDRRRGRPRNGNDEEDFYDRP